MENLTLEEAPPQGGAQMPLLGPGPPPQQNQQLPPQMFTTAAQLLDMTDSKGVFTFVCLNSCYWEGRKTSYF
jgi:U6 snRNA-associated Sm-like protein LSm1